MGQRTACACASPTSLPRDLSRERADLEQLVLLAQPVETARLPHQVDEPRAEQERALQVAAIRPGQTARLPIALGALLRQVLADAIAAEEHLAKAAGHRALVLEREQGDHGQVLVHLALQLQLELRHAATA